MNSIYNDETTLESHKEQLLQARLSQLEESASTRRSHLHEFFHLLSVRDTPGVLPLSTDTDKDSLQDESACSTFVETYGQGTIMDLEDWQCIYVSPAASPKLEVRQTRSRAAKAVAEAAKQAVQEQTYMDVDEDEDKAEAEENVEQAVIPALSPERVPSPPLEVDVEMNEAEDDHPATVEHPRENNIVLDHVPPPSEPEHEATAPTVQSEEHPTFPLSETQPQAEELEQTLDIVEEDDVTIEDHSKDALDIISAPTSPLRSPSPAVDRRRSVSRTPAKFSPSPPPSTVSFPADSHPPPQVLRPRTRSMSLAQRISTHPPASPSPAMSRSPVGSRSSSTQPTHSLSPMPVMPSHPLTPVPERRSEQEPELGLEREQTRDGERPLELGSEEPKPQSGEPELEDEADEEQGLEEQGLEEQGLEEQGLEDQGLEDQGLEDQGLEDQGLEDQGLEDQGLEGQRLEEQGLEDQGLEDQGSEEQGLEEPRFEEQLVEEQGAEEQGVEDQRLEEQGLKEREVEEQGLEEPGLEEQELEEQGLDEPGLDEQGLDEQGLDEQELEEQSLRQPDLQEPELREPELREPELREPELREPELEPELREPELQEPKLQDQDLQEQEPEELDASVAEATHPDKECHSRLHSESLTRSRSGSTSTSQGVFPAVLAAVDKTDVDISAETQEEHDMELAERSQLRQWEEQAPSASVDEMDVREHPLEMPDQDESEGDDKAHLGPLTRARSLARTRSRSMSKARVSLVVESDVVLKERAESVGILVHESDFDVEKPGPLIKLEEDDEHMSDMRMDEHVTSPLSRAPSASPAPSLSPVPSMPGHLTGDMIAPSRAMVPEESPTRSPSRMGSLEPSRPSSAQRSPTMAQLEGQQDDALFSPVDGDGSVVSLSPQPILPQSRTRSPSLQVQKALEPQPPVYMDMYRPSSPGTPLVFSPPKRPPLVLHELPAPLPSWTDFSSAFAHPGPEPKTQEDREPRTREGSLFSSASSPSPPPPSPPPVDTKLPDTTFPPLPSSPLLTPYSTSLALPSIEELPSTFSRKVHPGKLIRKREREREKEERERERERRGRVKEKDVKDDGKEKDKRDGKEAVKSAWLPWEISRWGAQFRANPAHKMVKKSGKAMTTRMWGVALHELRLMRALERIETLKQEGRWSFRQPKKQKNPIIAKSHLDWLLDEMKWMRTDFREERRWKIAVAFELAHEIRGWHLATPEDRKTFCVRRNLNYDQSAVKIEGSPMEVEMRLGLDHSPETEPTAGTKRATVDLPLIENETPGDALDVSGKEPEELDPEREVEIIRARQREQRMEAEATTQLQADDTGAEDDADADGEVDADGEMEVDEGEGVTGIMEGDEVGDALLEPTRMVDNAQDRLADGDLDAKDEGLKDNSLNPALTSDPERLLVTNALAQTPADKMKNQLRESLAYIPDGATFFDIDALCSEISDFSVADPFVPFDLPDIFPDLPAFQPLAASPSQTESIVTSKNDKKSEKKDKKFVEELTRMDEAASLKVVNTSIFMYYKPTLVSALQPAKRWRDDTWIGFDDTVITGNDAPVTLEPVPGGIFSNQKPRAPGAQAFNPAMRMPKDPQKRFNETPWSASEDQILKHFVDRYPNNWLLVADMFNSARVTISTDKRTAWDCLARWDTRWNDGRVLMPSSIPATPSSTTEGNVVEPGSFSSSLPPTPAVGQPTASTMMTRKRSASQLNLTINGQQAESRKRLRHNHMHEAMRKSAKKRETSLKQIATQNKRGHNSQVHETHAAFNKPTNRTPAELSRIKAEKDRREFEEYQQRKKQEEEMVRKHRAQMELMKQQAEATRRAQAAGQSAVGQPPVAVPIVRGPGHPQVNISQQPARVPTNVTALSGTNLAVPTLGQSMGIPAPMQGMNVNMQNFQRLSPQQQQALYAQMQARQAHIQAVQAQAQQQQQQQSQGVVTAPSAASANPGTSGHPHSQISPAPPHTSPHHPPQTHNSPPRHATPANGVGMVNMAQGGLVRPGSSQAPRPAASPSHQPASVAAQQPAMHHAFMQNQHASGMSQDQMKRLYQNQLYWTQQHGNAQAQAHTPGHIAYPGIPQQQQQQQRQQHSPPRPVSAQPNSNSTQGPPSTSS